MSEWLTTGRMIDTLKVGEVAVSDVGTTVIRNKSGDIGSKDSPTNTICINSVVAKRKWRILPKFVSFEEAMKAHEAGKVVCYHGHTDAVELWDRLLPGQKWDRVSSTGLGDFSLLGMWKGKWTIEGDS